MLCYFNLYHDNVSLKFSNGFLSSREVVGLTCCGITSVAFYYTDETPVTIVAALCLPAVDQASSAAACDF